MFSGTGREGVIAREIDAPRVAPSAFCTEAKVAKSGAYLRDTTVFEFQQYLVLVVVIFHFSFGAII